MRDDIRMGKSEAPETTGLEVIIANSERGSVALCALLNGAGFVHEGGPWTLNAVREARRNLKRIRRQGKTIHRVTPKARGKRPKPKRVKVMR